MTRQFDASIELDEFNFKNTIKFFFCIVRRKIKCHELSNILKISTYSIWEEKKFRQKRLNWSNDLFAENISVFFFCVCVLYTHMHRVYIFRAKDLFTQNQKERKILLNIVIVSNLIILRCFFIHELHNYAWKKKETAKNNWAFLGWYQLFIHKSGNISNTYITRLTWKKKSFRIWFRMSDVHSPTEFWY